MSNKKRRNREKQLETLSSELNESKAGQTTASESTGFSESNQSNNSKTGLFTYLKNPANFWVAGLIALFALGTLGAGLKYLDDAAKQDSASNGQNKSLLSKINPFTANPLPTATPAPLQLSKEYIYAGSRVLAVEDANANALPPADLAIWRHTTGQWYVMGGAGGSQQVTQNWGIDGDKPVPGDYDGDGKTDFCIFRPSANEWWVLRSSNGTYSTYGFGATSDVTAQADYDGDGKTDIALFRPSDQIWYIFLSSSSSMIVPTLSPNVTINLPSPADYDGDGKADIGGWNTQNSTFYYRKSTDQTVVSQPLGILGVPVSGDYDGDGKADISIWSPSNTTWYYWKSSNPNTIVSYPFGIATDLPVQNDYDNDGIVDMALWRAVNTRANDVGTWFIIQSSLIGQSNEIRVEKWGTTGDIPVPAFYRR